MEMSAGKVYLPTRNRQGIHAAYFTVQVSVTSPIFVIKAKETSHSHRIPPLYLANFTNKTLPVLMEDEYEYKYVALLGLFSNLQIFILQGY